MGSYWSSVASFLVQIMSFTETFSWMKLLSGVSLPSMTSFTSLLIRVVFWQEITNITRSFTLQAMTPQFHQLHLALHLRILQLFLLSQSILALMAISNSLHSSKAPKVFVGAVLLHIQLVTAATRANRKPVQEFHQPIWTYSMAVIYATKYTQAWRIMI